MQDCLRIAHTFSCTVFLFSLFDIDLSFIVVGSVVSTLFLILAVIPSIGMVEVGLREEISLQLMGMFTANALALVLLKQAFGLYSGITRYSGQYLIFGY